MKKSLIVLALMAAAFGVQAQSTSNSNASSTSSPTISSGNSGSESNAASISNPNNQANQQIQLNTYTPEHQSVTSTSSSSSTNRVINEGATTNNQNVHYSGTQTVKNVPGIAMSGPASGPCTGASGGVGVAGPGFGVGLNGAKVDDGCTVRENTRTLGQIYQALDSADPMKQSARDAMMSGMQILANMNAKIGGDYAPPQPAPKQAAATQPAPAPVVAAPAVVPAPAAVAQPAPAKPVTVAASQPVTLVAPPPAPVTDPYIRARMGLK